MRLSVPGAGRGGKIAAFRLLAVFGLAGSLLTAGSTPAHASTGQFRGINWADTRDNFVNGVLYVSGLGPSDTYSSAATVANQLVGQMYSITGANTVRMPINEPTVSNYWETYTGAIDTALSKGNVILAYWAHGGNSNAYFEVINEPYGYSPTDLDNMYNTWLARYAGVPRGRVILDGAGLATNVPAVGNDSRLNGTLLAVHDYTMFVGSPYDDETAWANHIASYIGGYASRTIATEWGAPMSPGSKYNIQWDTVDYSIPSGSFWADYVRGVGSELRSLGMGSVYWPGLRDGDWYSMTRRSGSGANIQLSLVNPSGLTRLRYAWGIGSGGGTYVKIRNANTGMEIDGMGNGASGSNAAQSGDTGSTNEQWVIENDGDYVRIKNRATGLYLDGMGRTTNGAAVGQYADTGSTNQQWSVVTDANNVRIKNRATGMYIDGMGSTGNAANLAQYGNTNSANQQWKIVAAG